MDITNKLEDCRSEKAFQAAESDYIVCNYGPKNSVEIKAEMDAVSTDIIFDKETVNQQLETGQYSVKQVVKTREEFLKEDMQFEQVFIKVESHCDEFANDRDIDEDYKFHTEIDLGNSNEKFEWARNGNSTDVYDKDTGIGNSSTVTSRTQGETNSEMNTLTEGNLFQCHNCNLTFRSPVLLEEHQRNCRTKTPTCSNTPTIKQMTSMSAIVVSSDAVDYRCCTCPDKVYTNIKLYITHMKRTHSMYPETYTTDVDGASSTCVLKQRTLAHVCEYCQKSFPQKSKLNMHVRVHTGERPYKCDTCGRAFTVASGLQSHMALHTSDTVYTCDTCNKIFKDRSNLSQHMLVHSKDKSHKCNLCQKTFTLSSTLKLHLRSHTGVKPYACNVCNKTFAQSSNLRVHERTHTGERPYMCDACNKTFTSSSNLRQHKRFVHI